ncbi:MAG: PTS sugar transporter subunit IIB [Eubacteriales bacterium]
MYNIALVCENGASTGMVVKKMKEAAMKHGIEVKIQAYPYTQLENFIAESDIILLGPQLAFKKDLAITTFPDHIHKIHVIATMDFGMMNGEKILQDAIAVIKG